MKIGRVEDWRLWLNEGKQRRHICNEKIIVIEHKYILTNLFLAVPLFKNFLQEHVNKRKCFDSDLQATEHQNLQKGCHKSKQLLRNSSFK